MKVAVCAFGTRGDVQPLAILSAGIAETSWCDEVVFVTHEAHRSFVLDLLRRTAGVARLFPVASPPVIWKGLEDSAAAEAEANHAQQSGCLEACEGAAMIVFNMFALEGFHIAEKLQVRCVVCQPYLMAKPMPSSFAGRMRRSYPRLFRRLKRPAPTSSTVESPKEEAPAIECPRDETGWDHVEHWMWPLFTDKWSSFRSRLGLGPCPLADGEDDESEALRILGERTHARPNRGEDGRGFPSRDEDSAFVPVARFPAVLYLFSSLVVEPCPFWPKTVTVCGYVFPKLEPAEGAVGREARGKTAGEVAAAGCGETHSPGTHGDDEGLDTGRRDRKQERCTVLPKVRAFLSGREEKPVLVSFGSMWDMCPPGYGLALALKAVLLGLKQAGVPCLLLLPPRPPVRDEEESGRDDEEGRMGCPGAGTELRAARRFVVDEFAQMMEPGNLLVHEGPMPHEGMLPRCALAIHHGGSGTTAAVIRAGIPHVVCPQQLDQFFWAERIGYLKIGSVLERSWFVGRDPAHRSPPASLVTKAASVILSALTPQVKLRAACLGVKIRGEDGLANAVDTLSRIASTAEGSTVTSAEFQGPPREESRRALATRQPGEAGPGSPALEVTSRGGASSTSRECLLETPGKSGCQELEGRPPGQERVYEEEKFLELQEMPNGIRLWRGGFAEEETMFIYREVFEDRTYARMRIRVYEGDTLWDVGANVGFTSIFFELAADSPDSINIYAFEPAPWNLAALRRNLRAHSPRATVLGYALGAKNEDGATLTFYPRMPGNSTLRPDEKERLQGRRMGQPRSASSSSSPGLGGESDRLSDEIGGGYFSGAQEVACDIRTVSRAMSSLGVRKIDLLKIDVEGSELEVLLGIGEEDWSKVMQVVAEVHPVGDRLERFQRLLRTHGFEVESQAFSLDGTPMSPAFEDEREDSRRTDDLWRAPANADTGRGADKSTVDGDSDALHGDGKRDTTDHLLGGVVYMVYARRPEVGGF